MFGFSLIYALASVHNGKLNLTNVTGAKLGIVSAALK